MVGLVRMSGLAMQVEAFRKDPLFTRLLDHKWHRFARDMYLRRRLVPYLALLACFVALLVVRWALSLSLSRSLSLSLSLPPSLPPSLPRSLSLPLSLTLSSFCLPPPSLSHTLSFTHLGAHARTQK